MTKKLLYKTFLLSIIMVCIVVVVPAFVYAQTTPTMVSQAMSPTYVANQSPTLGDGIVPGYSPANNADKVSVEIVLNPQTASESVCKWLGYAESSTTWFAPTTWTGNCDDGTPRTTALKLAMKFSPWKSGVGYGTSTYIPFSFTNSTIPSKIIVMMGFELDSSAASPGGPSYTAARQAINVGAGTLDAGVRSGSVSRATVNSQIAQFKSEGKLYLESVRSDRCYQYYDSNCGANQGSGSDAYKLTTDPTLMTTYWSKILDNYDGIIIDEYTESFTTDQTLLNNTLETLRRIRANPAYKDKVIMAAMVQSLGFSSCTHSSGCPYRSSLFAGLNQYTDRVFYENYINEYGYPNWPSQLSLMDGTTSYFPSAGLPLSKIVYGLYIPQTAERSDLTKDVYVTDNTPEYQVGAILEDQVQRLKTASYNGNAGVGFWIYYRANAHIIKTISTLSTHYITNGNTSRLTSADRLSLLQNGSFQTAGTAGIPANWTGAAVGTGASVVQAPAPTCTGTLSDGSTMSNWCSFMKIGTQSLKITNSATGYAIASQSATVESGKSYYLQGFFRGESGVPKGTLKVAFNDSAKTIYTKRLTLNTYWNLLKMNFTAPTGATQATVSVENSCSSPALGIYVDWMQLEKSVYGTDSDFTTNNTGSCIGTSASSASQNPTAIWHMDESSGSSVADSSGNNNTGTAINATVSTTSPKFGTAARSFDGTGDAITTPLQNIDTLTVSAWVTHSGNKLEYMWTSSAPGGTGIGLLLYGDTFWLYSLNGPVSNNVCSIPSNFNNGSWHHVAAVISTTKTALYYDGVQCGTATYHDPTGNFTMGNSGGNVGFTGKMDEVITYERALSDAEILALFNATGPYSAPTATPTQGPTSAPTATPTQGPTPTPFSGSGAYMNLNSAGGSPGILFSGDSSIDLGQGQPSSQSWVVGGFTFPEVYKPTTPGLFRTSYDYLTTIARQSGITPTNLSSLCNPASCTLPAALPNGVYQTTDSVTLNGFTFPANKSYVFLIKGDLTILGGIKVPVSSNAIFSVKGNITIDKSVGQSSMTSTVTDVEGLYSTDKNFILDGYNDCTLPDTQRDKRINIAGAVIVNTSQTGGTFQNKRDLCVGNLQCPAFAIFERPDFLTNFPNFMRVPNFIWKEVAP